MEFRSSNHANRERFQFHSFEAFIFIDSSFLLAVGQSPLLFLRFHFWSECDSVVARFVRFSFVIVSFFSFVVETLVVNVL
jgi:hypothetical protein